MQLYAQFDLVMAPSAGVAQRLRHWGVRSAVHQPLGVDCAVFNPAARDPAWRQALCQALGRPAHTQLLVYTGRFGPEKNLQLVADAVGHLGPHHVLLAVGAGPHPPIGPQVVLRPPEPDPASLARLIASCDAYVHAGNQETCGLGVLEAMACGTPVVVSAAGGLGELTEDTGWRVYSHRVREWTDALHSCLNDGDTRQTFRALQQAHRHDWVWIIEQMASRYVRLLARDRPAPQAGPAAEPVPATVSAPVQAPLRRDTAALTGLARR